MPIRLDYDWDHRIPHKSVTHVSNYPVITNVAVTSGGLVTWTTDIPSTSQVNYGNNPNIGTITPSDSTLVTSHSVQLSDLSGSAYWYFKVMSFYLDSLSISDLYSFAFISGSFITLEDGTGYILMEDGTRISVES